MNDYQAKITSKGQMTIPAEVRRRLGLKSGDFVTITVNDQSASLERSKHTVASVRGIIPALPNVETKDFDRLIEEATQQHADWFVARMREQSL